MILFPQTYLWIHDKYSFTSFKQRLTALGRYICTGNSMIWSDIWYTTTSNISKLLYVISRAVGRVNFEKNLKYQEWYFCQVSRTNHDTELGPPVLIGAVTQTVSSFRRYCYPLFFSPSWEFINVCRTGENPDVWVSGLVIRDLVFCPYGKQSETVLFFCLRHLLATRKV